MRGDQRLRELRDRIDVLDAQIQELISERACCTQATAESKSRARTDNYYSPEREAQVLRRVVERN